MDVNGSDLPGHERQDLQSCSSEGLDNDHFDAPRRQTATHPERARFPRLNQPLQQRTQSQPQQCQLAFNWGDAVEAIRCKSRNSNPRQLENARTSFSAHGKGVHTTTRTPVPLPIPIKENILSRERGLSVTANVGNVGLEMEDLAMKVMKEKNMLKAELVQTRTNLTRKLVDVEEKLAVSLARNNEQDQHVETLKHELSLVRSELLSAKATSDSHRRDLVSTKEDLISVSNQNVVLASTNQKLEGFRGHVKAKLEAMQNAHAKLLMSLTDLKILHDSATARIFNLSDGVAECRKSANDALTKFERTYQDPHMIMGTTQVRAVLDDLRDTLSESSRTNDLLRDKLHHHLGQIVELNDRIKELESEKRELLNLLVVQNSGMRVEELSDRLAKREAEVEIVTANAVTLKVELRASESRISDLLQQIAGDAVKLESTQRECDVAKKALAVNGGRLSDLEQSISLTTKQRDECRQMLGNVESELALARMEIDNGKKLQAAKDTEMAQLRAASDVEQALKASQETITELKHIISAKAGKYKSVEASLRNARRELSQKETLLKQRRVHLDPQKAVLQVTREQFESLQVCVSRISGSSLKPANFERNGSSIRRANSV
ncbi:hypothetical protein APHAL10511_006595 [Amanita phalloides]|nr:hypothetical protein APHAL10511_006595 [Amanita phalloides]